MYRVERNPAAPPTIMISKATIFIFFLSFYVPAFRYPGAVGFPILCIRNKPMGTTQVNEISFLKVFFDK